MIDLGGVLARVHAATEPVTGEDRVSFWPLLGGLVVAAVLIRWGRLPVVWDYWAIDYVSYTYYHWDDLTQGRFPWTRLIGMHPGQYALLMALVLKVTGSLGALFGIAVIASCASMVVGAVWVRRLGGSWAGLLLAGMLAVSPYQAHYGMELNNYPLFLLMGSLLIVAVWACWNDPTRPRLIALGVIVAAALHTHFFTVPLVAVLAVVVALTRRWHMQVAIGAGAVTALPVMLGLASIAGEPGSYTGELPGADLLAAEIVDSWVGRFGSSHALFGVLVAAGLGTVSALRERRTRLAALLLLGTAVCLSAVNTVGFLTGAARIFQTPYWVLPSWCAFALIALGCSAVRRVLWMVPLLILVPWVLEAGHRAAWPCARAEAQVGVWTADGVQLLQETPTSKSLGAYLRNEVNPSDVVIYVWEPVYINDQPHRRDPLFAAIPPGEVGPWDPESVDTGFGFEFRGGTVYFRNVLPLRGDEYEQAFGEALEEWIARDRRVHLVLGNVDPELPVPDDSELRAMTARHGARWGDRWLESTRVSVIEVR